MQYCEKAGPVPAGSESRSIGEQTQPRRILPQLLVRIAAVTVAVALATLGNNISSTGYAEEPTAIHHGN